MVVNDKAYLLAKRGALESIASKLAPTEDYIRLSEQHCAPARHYVTPLRRSNGRIHPSGTGTVC
ncbi:hypothetical protein C8K63_108274 [Pseudomonas sp. GV085]|nr:hypothetical protein C8K63_108274 [Pseudomonas sp. GV085]